jgi:hypothetical protein
LQSTNGTYLNGSKLTERALLQPVDELRLGQQGPVVRAFAIDDQADAEGTVHESNMPRQPIAAPKPKAPPPTAAALPLSPPPPLPAMSAASARRESRHEPDDSGSFRDDRGGARRASRPHKSNTPLYIGLIGGGVLLVGTFVGILIWQLGKKKPEVVGPLTPEQIHKRVAKSSTFIMVKLNAPPPNDSVVGTGSLIDKEKKLVSPPFM